MSSLLAITKVSSTLSPSLATPFRRINPRGFTATEENEIVSLYLSGYRPARLPKRYEATSIMIEGKGQLADRMRQKGVPPMFGDPVDAVAFFDEDGDGSMVAMTADYPNGKRVEWRRRSRDTTLSFTRTPIPAGIEGRG